MERQLSGSSLLECVVRVPATAYELFQSAPRSFFEDTAAYFMNCGKLLPTLMEYIELDIEKSNSSEALFREDSVTTKFLSGCLYASDCEPFLLNTVTPTILEVKNLKNVIQLNPDKIEPGQPSVESNLKVLTELLDTFIDSLGKNILSCPLPYRYLLKNIKAMIAKKFSSEDLERHIVCSFFFLRFVCPALVSPEKYRVPLKQGRSAYFTESLPIEYTRSMVIVSKVLHAIGNGLLFDGSKESWMQVANPYIASKSNEISRYYQMLFDPESIAKAYIQGNSWANHAPQGTPLPIPDSCDALLRQQADKVDLVSSGPLSDTIRTLAPVSAESHPITWSAVEVHIWLRSVGLGKYISAFRTNQIYGLKFVKLCRNDLKQLMGVVRFSQQTDILQHIRDLVSNSARLIPKESAQPSQWNLREVIIWLEKLNLEDPLIIRNFESCKINGSRLLSFPDDAFCYLGVPVNKLNQLIIEVRKLQVNSHRSTIQMITKQLSSRKHYSRPNIYDQAVDEWLDTFESGLSASSPALSELSSLPSSSPENHGNIVLIDNLVAGMLARKKHLHNSWKARWFVLDLDQKTLSEMPKCVDITATNFTRTLFKSLKARSTMKLHQFTVRSVVTGHPDCFCIMRKNKDYLTLQAGSPSLAQQWVQQLMRVSQGVHMEKLNLETFAIPVVVASNSGKIISLNKPALRFFEFEDESVIAGQPIKILIPALSSLKPSLENENQGVICMVNGQPIPSMIRLGTCILSGKHRVLISFRTKRTYSAPTSMPMFMGVSSVQSAPATMGFLSFIDPAELDVTRTNSP